MTRGKKAAPQKPRMKMGRKWFDGQDEQIVISKCKEVWAIDGTDAECSFYADISTAALSRYLDAHPELKEIRNRLKEKPILLARQTIVKGIKESFTNAMDYMKRKKRGEFGDKFDISGGVGLNITFDGTFNTAPKTKGDRSKPGKV